MRLWIIAFAAVALTACNKEQATQDVRQTDEELARDDLMTNDLTAIDAASGADSNMAADIDVANMALNVDEEEGSPSSGDPAARRPSSAATDSRSDTPDTDRPAATNDTAPPETDDGAAQP